MRLPTLAFATLHLAFAGLANAQAIDGAITDPTQLVSRWQATNATCRNPTATAIAAVGACEQRDTLSKLLAQMNYCYGAADKTAPATWTACSPKAVQEQAQARTMAQFHRMGGVFVLPAVINGGTKSFFIVDSGAAHVQIPEEVAEEMKRAGTLEVRFPRATPLHPGRRAAAPTARVPAEEPADRRPDDGERAGRRRRPAQPRPVGSEFPAAIELVEDRQCEKRDRIRVHRLILATPSAPAASALHAPVGDARPTAARPPSS